MSLSDSVQKLYQKYKSNTKYNTTLTLSEIGGWFGAAAGAKLLDSYNLNKYLSSDVGGVIGHYFSAVITFGIAWYLLNREHYSQTNNFLRECGEMTVKNLIPAGISYLVYGPIAAGFVYKGFAPVTGNVPSEAAFYASILSGALFMVGSNLINQRIIKSHNL